MRMKVAAIAQLEERRASDRKVADSWFDYRTFNVSLCPLERRFTLISL